MRKEWKSYDDSTNMHYDFDQHLSCREMCIRDRMEEFYYALDEMNQYQMTAGWLRRSVRSRSYAPFAAASIRLLRAYARLNFYGGNLAAVLTGQIAPEMYDHARTESWDYAGILAARIDRGDAEMCIRDRNRTSAIDSIRDC